MLTEIYSKKHLFHCAVFLAVLLWSISRSVLRENDFQFENLSLPFKVLLCFFYTMSLLKLPFCLAVTIGILLFDSFPSKVKLRANLTQLPKICFRVVTRGDYPKLIAKNMERNLKTCSKIGLGNFVYEIVTQKKLECIGNNPLTRQVVVPEDYVTTKGTLFKARNLQYCLEDEVNVLRDEDWIVHLDEDSVLTENSVKGIANFVSDDLHCFGNGVINLNCDGSNSILSKIMDIMPIIDYGLIRFQIKMFGKSYYGFRDTFMVAKVKAEKDVSFDVEPGPSLAEDTAFGLMAILKGYTMGMVEGEVLEQGCSSYGDCFRRYRRIINGQNTIYSTSYFDLGKCKAYALLSAIGIPYSFTFPCLLCNLWYPLPLGPISLAVEGYLVGITVYTQVFIILKNVHRNLAELIFTVILSILIGIPLQMITLFGILIDGFNAQNRESFYISEKVE